LPPSFDSLMGFLMVLHICGEVGWRRNHAMVVLQEHLGRHTCTQFYAHGALQLVGTFHNPLPLPPSFDSLMGFLMVLHMCGEVGWRLIYAIIVLQEHLGRHTCTIFTHMGPCSLWELSTTPCPCPYLLTLWWASAWSCTCVVKLFGD
jgi:hypothetical protein